MQAAANDDQKVIDSAKRAAFQKLEQLVSNVIEQVNIAAAKGQMRNSRSVFIIANIYKAGFRGICEAASVRVAEARGTDAIALADQLDDALSDLEENVLAAYPKSRWPATFQDSVETEFSKIKAAWLKEKSDVIDDLRIGIAGGVNVSKQHSVSIDARGGAAQIAVDSPGATQTVGGDLTAQSDINIVELKTLLEEFRSAMKEADLPEESRDEIEDAVVSTERELEQSAPNEGRIKRYLLSLSEKAYKFGVPTARKLLEGKLEDLGWITLG